MTNLHLSSLRNYVTLLEQIPASQQLATVRRLCIDNGGRWDPNLDARYERHPVIFEIQLFGVSAVSDSSAEIAQNWLKAARNIVTFSENEAA